MSLKPIPSLELGFRDAENYKKREYKELFNQIFIRTPELDRLCSQSIYFLIGEKGTGKTAYAVYLSNMEYKDNVATLRYLREVEYQKFVQLKQEKHLTLSDYTNIWKVIIYLLLAQQIREKIKNPLLSAFPKFDRLAKAIDEFYQYAFSPEIINAIQFSEQAAYSAELISKVANLAGQGQSTISFAESRYQINLLYIQRQFEEALSSLKLNQNFILFIDGIDIRPESIEYTVYLDCIKGLASAVWEVNNDFFANIKDSKGRMRVVLLVRPDIFNVLGFQNLNSKVRDNSVILNWVTTYAEHRSSGLFSLADRLLSYQQEQTYPPGSVWDYYFPFDADKVRAYKRSPSSFISLLRFSLYRPRDVITILSILKENFIEQNRNSSDVFEWSDFVSPLFTRKYSDYLLGEIRDHILFYYSRSEYELFIKFFQFLNGKNFFDYTTYIDAYKSYLNFMRKNRIPIPAFCDTPDNFLQFLYELNVLCYLVPTNNEPFFGWCFRDRSPSNVGPKVRTNVSYKIHQGLMKSLDLGKHLIVETAIDWDWDDVGGG